MKRRGVIVSILLAALWAQSDGRAEVGHSKLAKYGGFGDHWFPELLDAAPDINLVAFDEIPPDVPWPWRQFRLDGSELRMNIHLNGNARVVGGHQAGRWFATERGSLLDNTIHPFCGFVSLPMHVLKRGVTITVYATAETPQNTSGICEHVDIPLVNMDIPYPVGEVFVEWVTA